MATNNNEFFDALAALEKERGLPADYLIDKIKAAIVIAVKKDYEVEDDNVVVDIDPNIGAFRASLFGRTFGGGKFENPTPRLAWKMPRRSARPIKWASALLPPSRPKSLAALPPRPQSM